MNIIKNIYATIGLCIIFCTAHGIPYTGENTATHRSAHVLQLEAAIEAGRVARLAQEAHWQADINHLRATNPELYQQLSSQALERSTRQIERGLAHYGDGPLRVVVTEELRATHPYRHISAEEIENAVQAQKQERIYQNAQRILGEHLQRNA